MGRLILRDSGNIFQDFMEIRPTTDFFIGFCACAVHAYGNNIRLRLENIVKQLIKAHPIGTKIFSQAEPLRPR